MSVFVIAELGINHNGSLLTTLKLIDEAKKAGADAVKFQTRTIDKVYSKEELDKLRESPWGSTNREQKIGLEFTLGHYKEIDHHCRDIGITWFSSPWDLSSVKFLENFDLKYNKVASALLTHIDLLYAIAQQHRHTFISTGMSTLTEIATAVSIFKSCDCPYTLMHCTSTYPMKDEQANLLCLETLRKEFKCDVGYSSHSTGIIAPVMATVLGATAIEAHLTLDRAMYGSDQAASLEPHGFAKMVEYIRYWDVVKGDGIKVVYPEETPIMKKLRRVKDY